MTSFPRGETPTLAVLIALTTMLLTTAVPAVAQKNDPPPTEGYALGGRGTAETSYDVFDSITGRCVNQFIDATGGTEVVEGDDVLSGPLALDEPFSFFGATRATVRASTNGFLTFSGTSSSDLSNSCPYPDGSQPDAIGVVHDDIHMGNNPPTQGVFQEYFASCPRANDIDGADEGCTVFQWDEAEHFFSSAPFDMQAVLYHTSGQIVLAWDDRNPDGGSGSTTGIYDSIAGDSVTYACDTGGTLSQAASVCFVPFDVPTVLEVPVSPTGHLLLVGALAGLAVLWLRRS